MLARSLLSIIAASAIVFSGCQARSRARMAEIQQFGFAYHEYHAAKKQSPRSIEDLRDQVSKFPELADDIRSGQFVVIWNAVLNPDGNENDKYVLGYEKQVPERGGLVLRGGGVVEKMTPEVFAKIPALQVKQ